MLSTTVGKQKFHRSSQEEEKERPPGPCLAAMLICSRTFAASKNSSDVYSFHSTLIKTRSLMLLLKNFSLPCTLTLALPIINPCHPGKWILQLPFPLTAVLSHTPALQFQPRHKCRNPPPPIQNKLSATSQPSSAIIRITSQTVDHHNHRQNPSPSRFPILLITSTTHHITSLHAPLPRPPPISCRNSL